MNKPLTLAELENSIKNSQNGKSPGNNGLTIEFYIVFWRNISNLLLKVLLIEKKRSPLPLSKASNHKTSWEKKDKRLIGNWRPISLINYDTKLLSKTLAERLIKILPFIISHDQTAYVANRFLGESVRLISDIIETTKNLNIVHNWHWKSFWFGGSPFFICCPRVYWNKWRIFRMA